MPIPDLAEERANSVYILLLLEPILFSSPSTRILNWILHNSLQIAKYEL